MFGRLFEALNRLVEGWLERRGSDAKSQQQYRQLEFDWHTLKASGMDTDD